ncbi:hypothetical protein A4X13_0g4489 [Tilletia indica]|uniref:Uncharacterized protein n=1 Tax=Tilletia indica TaxID=43049 RepID=A0A177T7S1_9BASI|nr:hypothetical protein A4X13_0g4489 [Tilletia indica]
MLELKKTSGSQSGSEGAYEGSDWDEIIKEEIEEEDALRKTKAPKRKRATSKTAGSSSKDRSQPARRRRRVLMAAGQEKEQAEPAPRKIRSGARYFGPKWSLLPDGRYQYIYDSDETVSGNEDRNPLWDLLGMDRQGRLIQPFDSSDNDDTAPDDTAPESDSDDNLPSLVVNGARPSTLGDPAKNGSQAELLLQGEAPPGLNVNSSLPPAAAPPAASSSSMKPSTARIEDSGSASESDLSADERRKRRRAKLQRKVKKEQDLSSLAPSGTHARSVSLSGVSASTSQTSKPSSSRTSTASGPITIDPASDERDVSQSRLEQSTKKGKGKALARPEWWGKDAIDGLPEEQLLPRPNFNCSEEVKKNTPPLHLGTNEKGKVVQVPKTINRFLRDYQRDGIRFLYNCYSEGRGGILGDDMGLGKTCQTISFLAAIMDKKGLGQMDQHRRKTAVEAKQPTPWPTALVVCPNSVVENWSREFDMWGWFEWKTMDMKSFKQVLKDLDNGYLDVVIATHDFVTNHIDEIGRKPFGCIVVDEVHRVKNADAARTKAYKSFRCKTRFGLTGTAVQNDFGELHTMLDWSNPGRVGNKRQWDRTINMPLQRLLDKDLTEQGTYDEQIRRLAFLQRLLPKFYLRRDKRIIAHQMPVKRDFLIFCSLTEEQVMTYNRLLHFHNVENFIVAKEPCGCGRRHPVTRAPMKVGECCWPVSVKRRLLMWITILKQASDHTALLYWNPEDNFPGDPVKYGKYVKQREICKVMYPDDWESKRCTVQNGLRAELCGKWLVLQNLLREWKKAGDKVLLFSQNLRLLDWLETLVQLAGFVHRRLDGTTAQALRQSYVDDFNYSEDITVFLISTMAGGVGLNLTAANKVVIFDPHWNPAVDQQAQDRAYRIGQTRDVDVYRLVGSGSLEERIFRRQIHKQQLANLAYGDEKQERYFSGVKGVKGSETEIWGMASLFTFEPRKVPAGGLIEEVNLEEAEAFAQDLEHAVKAPAVTPTKDATVKGKAKGTKGKGKGKASDDKEGDPAEHVALDPMEALILQDQALAELSSDTADEDPSTTEEKEDEKGKSATRHGQVSGEGVRSVRHDQLIAPGKPQGPSGTAEPRKVLRRLDDVPTIYHQGDTVIIGRPSHLCLDWSSPTKTKAEGKGAASKTPVSSSLISSIGSKPAKGDGDHTRQLPAGLSTAAGKATPAGPPASSSQSQSQAQTQMQTQSESQQSQSQVIKPRWRPPSPRRGQGSSRHGPRSRRPAF